MVRVVVFGNTRWKTALAEGGEIRHREEGTYPFPAPARRVDVTLWFSVNRSEEERARPLLEETCRHLLRGEAFRSVLPVCYARPETFGEDRLLLVAFGMSRKVPTLIVDAGTAITVNLIHPERGYAGGAILPGLAMAFGALHRHTSLLPLVDADIPEDPGCSTESAMRLGVVRGSAGAVRELSSFLESRLFPASERFLTGGDAPLLAPALPDFQVEPDLPFRGALWLFEQYGKLFLEDRHEGHPHPH